MVDLLSKQLQLFGFETLSKSWHATPHHAVPPLATVFIPDETHGDAEDLNYIANIRSHYPTSQLIYLAKVAHIEPIVALMRAGIDITLPNTGQVSAVINCVLNLIQTQEKSNSRALIVEDSITALAAIKRILTEHGIESHAITDPSELFKVLASYQPDLILMDIHMPRFSGVEATRVLRQMAQYHTIPIVYLSAEYEVGMQVEALRLGGDQFLIKPANPVLLTAIVKTKIERSNEMQRSTTMDGLRGLLNHASAKLKNLLEQISGEQTLSMVMIDIDRFKSINDTYGHPVGDQVIQHIAWLLKGHFRPYDMIGRYGGEEFIVALPDTNAAQALQIINRIRETFATLPHPHAQGALLASFSAGIATYNAW